MSSNAIPARIKLARKMAGLDTQAQLLERIKGWSASRLGNYEAGISTPAPDDVLRIAEVTGTSPCWLMFGLGPIRPSERDLQAIRHQNLSNTVHELQERRGAVARLVKAMAVSKQQLEEHLDNPFLPIGDGMARRYEKHIGKRIGWMDEQHVENDPLCMSFPEDIRELMDLYSGLSPAKRRVVLKMVAALASSMDEVFKE